MLATVHGIVESEELMAGQDSSHDQKPLVLSMFFSYRETKLGQFNNFSTED